MACPREPGQRGDPAYLRLREKLAGGALPFTTQGNENGLTIEGGETLGYELVTALASLPGGLDDLIIQVGGGALASSCIQALREGAGLGVLDRLPRVHTVQTAGAHPLERAYGRVRALLPPEPGPEAVRLAMAEAAAHRSAFMQPWEETPHSVATGILDDETYDWRAVVEGMLTTGGRPLVVSEALLREANQLAVSATGIRADPTGSAGLAGLLELRRSGAIGDTGRAAVLLTGIQRDCRPWPAGPARRQCGGAWRRRPGQAGGPGVPSGGRLSHCDKTPPTGLSLVATCAIKPPTLP